MPNYIRQDSSENICSVICPFGICDFYNAMLGLEALYREVPDCHPIAGIPEYVILDDFLSFYSTPGIHELYPGYSSGRAFSIS